MADLYNYLLRHHQDLVKYYYRAIEHLRPYESSLLFRFTSRYTRQLFEKFCPADPGLSSSDDPAFLRPDAARAGSARPDADRDRGH
jgi:hypothetical protein